MSRWQVFINPKGKPTVFVDADSKDEALATAAPKLLLAVGRPDLDREPKEQES